MPDVLENLRSNPRAPSGLIWDLHLLEADVDVQRAPPEGVAVGLGDEGRSKGVALDGKPHS